MIFGYDSIFANSLIGFDIRCKFKIDEDDVIKGISEVFSRRCLVKNDNYVHSIGSEEVLIEEDNGVYTIHTCQFSYFEVVYLIPKILAFLKKNAKSYDSSCCDVFVGFRKEFIQLGDINLPKYLLSLKEDYITKMFGDRINTQRCRSVKELVPMSLDVCKDGFIKVIDKLKNIDDKERIYAIDFTSLHLDIVKFKYIGGKEWFNDSDKFIKVLNYYILSLYDATSNKEFTEKETQDIEKYDKKFANISNAFTSAELFSSEYKDIKLTSDLKEDTSLINLMFGNFKEQLFNIVVINKLTKCEVNYDSDNNRIQLRGAKLENAYKLNGFDIVESTINDSNILSCDLYDCKLDDCDINDCNFFGFSTVKNSSVRDSFISRNIKLVDCSVSGNLGNMAGEMVGGELRNTTLVTSTAQLKNVNKLNVNEIA